VVTAPAAGLVTAVNIEVGDTYNGSTIAVINNVDTFDVTTEIDEYDINDIAEGQEVVIKTNATGDQELSGVVTKVSPIATGSGSSGSLGGSLGGMDISSILGGSSSSLTGSSSDDVTFTVTIHVNTISDKLRIGMTAKLSIIKQKNEDVLSVPYNAVQSDDDETFYVEKITGTSEEDGSCITQRITVVKGIESDYYTEIIGSDLSQGDQVLLPKTEGGNSLQDLINESGSMGGV
jgi:multidrug efflux pump subunit AcrA (membrane-fusion protein)